MIEEHGQEQLLKDEEIHLREYLQILIKRYKIALTFFIITVTTVLIITLAQTPQYKATTQLLIERSKSVDLTHPYGYTQYDPYFLDTQFELIKSKNVIYRVVEDLRLDTDYRSHFIKSSTSFSPIGIIKSWGSALIKFLVRTGKNKQSNSSSDVVPEETTDADIIASKISGHIEVSPVRETNVVNIAFQHENPVIAKMVVNGIAKSYMAQLLEIKMQSSNYTVAWMTKKAEEEKKKLEQSELALQNYTREHDIVTVENKIAVTPQQLSEFSAQLSKAQTQRKEAEEVYQQITKLKDNYKAIENLPVFANNENLRLLKEKLLVSEQQISELSKKFGSKHPAMIKANEERSLLLLEKKNIITQFIETTKNQYELAQNAEANVKQLLEETKQKALNMNEKLIQYNILKRETDTEQIMYEALIKQIKERSATEQTQSVDVFIIEQAKTPKSPASPKKGRNLMLAVVLGLFGGIGMAFFVEYLDNTINSPDQLEERFNLPVLGIVQQLMDNKFSLTEALLRDTNSALTESYRMIRSSIMLSSPDNIPKIILVTSSIPGEGKTSTSINLARTIALEGKSVVVIDCDLRKPKLNRLLDLNNNIGLSTFLAGLSKDNIINQPKDRKIKVITSGPTPPNPAELLGSEKMKKLLEILSEKFDCIVLDSTPILSVTDSLVLGPLSDCILLVVRANKTTYEILQNALKRLKQLNVTATGAVLNGVLTSKTTDYSYYYGGYYTDNYIKTDTKPPEQA